MQKPLRIVIDTNLVLSALVFGGGAPLRLRRGWEERRYTPLLSKSTASELIRVLAYPKFGLNKDERSDQILTVNPI